MTAWAAGSRLLAAQTFPSTGLMFSSINELYSYIVWRLQDTLCQMEKHLEVGKISCT